MLLYVYYGVIQLRIYGYVLNTSFLKILLSY